MTCMKCLRYLILRMRQEAQTQDTEVQSLRIRLLGSEEAVRELRAFTSAQVHRASPRFTSKRLSIGDTFEDMLAHNPQLKERIKACPSAGYKDAPTVPAFPSRDLV